MDWFSSLPIRRRLTLIILITCSLVMLLACTVLALYEVIDFKRTAVRDATVLADIIAQNSQAALSFDDPETGRTLLKSLRANSDVSAVRLYQASGAPFVSYAANLQVADLPEHPGEDGHHLERQALVVVRPIHLESKRIGTIYLRMSLTGMYARLEIFIGISGMVLAGSLLVAFGLSSRLQRPISDPILALAKIAQAVAENKDYSVRAPPQGQNEIGVLTEAFNHMLAQISRRAEELAAINAELEQFAYIASHDLKEPLRMVTQYMDILERQLGPTLSPPHRRFLGFAVDGAQRMQTLINDLLSYTRTNHVHEPRKEVDLQQVIQEVLTTFQERIDECHALVSVAELPKVHGERTKLALVFQNLIGNALKFHLPDKVPRIDITAVDGPESVVVAVRDNGIGINPTFHKQIFDVFQRLHGRDEYPGNGMGLAICRKILEQHHGQLTVESNVGAGSTFLVSLPRESQPTPPSGPELSESPASQNPQGALS
jgi:signal transduction histidine kinase